MRVFAVYALFVVVGVLAGGAGGLFAPFVVAKLIGVKDGSYENFLVPWLFTVSGGAVVGGWVGSRVARKVAAQLNAP